ncbi:MAG: TIGR02757 family protein [Sphingobacteriales bacterium 17-39-43]|uniref:TIGR02757 family protein n=1 Tax=Daejeonella sp. TaxID=2805397 RepID=UPI000BD71916|nr:TIGR02757 family protein [Daejeonella sp.]OYZ32867.1 MAG: TIGR02757 family protein [Sphingobacteriales bacterium 16-39-50]OZA26277.1 MAG: TIGR02757 family protein [Sphingobacteriales bacterium 17-39-43]HQT23552.1 TIGR02757 family protein [Daejeonella sp.]HQT56133.1 TIGR02757 family protein [Daejeonella sp.]
MADYPSSFHTFQDLKEFLDIKFDQYNRPGFIENDPICIPHQFTKKQDIEIMGFWASILAWGQRKTIINKCSELITMMDGAPYDFIKNHRDTDLKRFTNFKHRTFNDTDTLYFIEFFRQHYLQSDTLETAFKTLRPDIFRKEFLEEGKQSLENTETASSPCYVGELINKKEESVIEIALNSFRNYFFSLPDFPARTKKHISSPSQKSTCKRLNMFLRWMVRKDDRGVDFGLWNSIRPSDLICPTDLHVERVARKLKLISRKQVDWQTATELTENLRKFDPLDPVKYDFALFGLGIEEQFQNRIT